MRIKKCFSAYLLAFMAFKTNNKVLDLRAASEVADVAVVVLDM
jgi:hypothetical protein